MKYKVIEKAKELVRLPPDEPLQHRAYASKKCCRGLFTLKNFSSFWEGNQFQHIARMRHLASQLYRPGLDLICEVQTSISLPSFSRFFFTVTDTCPGYICTAYQSKHTKTEFFCCYISVHLSIICISFYFVILLLY